MKNLQRWGSVTAIMLVVANSHLVLIKFCLSEVVIQPPNFSPQYIIDIVVSNGLVVWSCWLSIAACSVEPAAWCSLKTDSGDRSRD